MRLRPTMMRRQWQDYFGVVIFIAILQTLLSPLGDDDGRSRFLEEGDAEHPADFSHLRFLSFGTSRAWGSGLKNRLDAYPYLLSENATNLAIRAAGCEYPSLCTMSMVGNDSIYDVITIEYSHVMAEKEFYQTLATKLRHRFPDATIIFLYAWSPFQYRSTDLTAFDVRRKLYPSARGLRNKLDVMWNDVAQESKEWEVTQDAKNKRIVHETAELVQGFVWELPQLDDPKENLQKLGPLFLADCTHYSRMGHMYIQKGITGLLNLIKPTRHDTVGPWDSWDRCESWYASGTTNFPTTMKMVEFSEQKHALEAPGSIEFELDRPALLSVNFMAGGPEQIYPRSELRVGGQHVEVTPLVENYAGGKKAVHVVQTLKVGMVEPGHLKLHIYPKETKQNPFRMVGIVLTTPTTTSTPEVEVVVSATTDVKTRTDAHAAHAVPREMQVDYSPEIQAKADLILPLEDPPAMEAKNEKTSPEEQPTGLETTLPQEPAPPVMEATIDTAQDTVDLTPAPLEPPPVMEAKDEKALPQEQPTGLEETLVLRDPSVIMEEEMEATQDTPVLSMEAKDDLTHPQVNHPPVVMEAKIEEEEETLPQDQPTGMASNTLPQEQLSGLKDDATPPDVALPWVEPKKAAADDEPPPPPQEPKVDVEPSLADTDPSANSGYSSSEDESHSFWNADFTIKKVDND